MISLTGIQRWRSWQVSCIISCEGSASCPNNKGIPQFEKPGKSWAASTPRKFVTHFRDSSNHSDRYEKLF